MDTNFAETPTTSDVVESNVVATEAEAETTEKVTIEEFKISGDALVTKIKDLLHQGNIRRISIKDDNGHTLIEIPMTVGIIGGTIGTIFFPVVAAVGVIGAMVAHLTVVIERPESSESSDHGKEED
ncbi:MAG: DUF4342 domain-containing protein [Cyanobacteria bacterium P01_E01_bin.6]